MNIKIFCLVNFVSFASAQAMNLPLSLAHLEKTLTQLTKFLVTEKPTKEPDIETKLTQLEQNFKAKESTAKEAIDKEILRLEYHLQVLQLLFEKLNVPLENLYTLPLKNAQFDSSGKPLNDVAQKANIEVFSVYNIVQNVAKTASTIELSLSNIGNHFRQNSFNQDQKKIIISLLTGQNTKIKNMLQRAQDTLRQLTGREPWIWYVDKQPLLITFFLKKVIDAFNCMLQDNNITFLRIKELIEDNQKSIENDIKNIKHLQQKVLEIYDQILAFLTEMKKADTKKITAQEANIEIKKFININTDPLLELSCLIGNVVGYFHFIKDVSIRNKLSEAVADILLGKNFSANLQAEVAAANVLANFPNTAGQIKYIQFLFDSIEKAVKKMDTTSKNIK